MNPWTHSICDECWAKLEPGLDPGRMREPERETCCVCFKPHSSGIYLRRAPLELPCKGEHAA